MTVSRRKMLGLVGGGVVLAAGAATAGFVNTRTPIDALAPWDTAGAYGDPRKRALSYALLAPNPHNLQPWMAELRGSDTVVLTMDPNRTLPATDPNSRQLVIGMGCFIELMVQAAAQDGYATALQLFPEGEGPGRPVAIATFTQGGQPDPLFAAVAERRTCKEPMDMARPVTDDQILQVTSKLSDEITTTGTAADDRVASLRDIAWDAWMIEATTEATWGESVDLLRVGKAEINANPDGIDLRSPFLEVLRRTGMMDRDSLMDQNSQGFKGTLEAYRATFAATPAFVWSVSEDNTRQAQIAAGRAWVRMNLKATLMGLSLHPISQCLQEYPEMAENYALIHRTLAQPGQTVQMLGRLGYGPEIPRSPRWGLDAKMVNA
ncbi:MAG: twin-arginine translocation pathway signal protein [Pseudomonadota bacterium]